MTLQYNPNSDDLRKKAALALGDWIITKGAASAGYRAATRDTRATAALGMVAPCTGATATRGRRLI